MNKFALRSSLLHFLDDPATGESAWQFFDDGILLVENGHVVEAGPAAEIQSRLPEDVRVHRFSHHLIVPGFIDTHIHFPQVEMMASAGEKLLPWLERFTFPAEQKYSKYEYAKAAAQFFIGELLRNGTTSAMVYATVFPESVEALFDAAREAKMRLIAGKVLMDQNVPESLQQSPPIAEQQTRYLIEKWHNTERLRYAITPRFAPSCSPDLLKLAGNLLSEYPDVYLQTHLAENTGELAWVKQLFPQASDYVDVYLQAGLVTERSVFAHGIHLSDAECQVLGHSGCSVAHCPTSNLFLGSGLMDLYRLQRHNIKVGLGSDIGAGTSFSLFKTMDEAYKAQQLKGNILDPMKNWYLASLGGAKVLGLDSLVGNFKPGKEADFVVLNLRAMPLLEYRLSFCRSLSEMLAVILTLADDRVVEKVYLMGECVK